MLVLCLIGFLVLSGITTASVVQNVKTNRRLDDYSEGFKDFFTAESEAGGTAFNQSVNQFADIIAEKLALTTQAAIRGSMGGVQRTINQGLEQTALDANPALGAMELLPKSLRKNPLAMAGLQTLMQQTMGGKQQNRPSDNGNSNQVKFSF